MGLGGDLYKCVLSSAFQEAMLGVKMMQTGGCIIFFCVNQPVRGLRTECRVDIMHVCFSKVCESEPDTRGDVSGVDDTAAAAAVYTPDTNM